MGITSLTKEVHLFFNLTLFSYGPTVHLISWKLFVSFIGLRDNARVEKVKWDYVTWVCKGRMKSIHNVSCHSFAQRLCVQCLLYLRKKERVIR